VNGDVIKSAALQRHPAPVRGENGENAEMKQQIE